MRFKGLDLNLLVALDVLLDERSVSVAAQRLHLSQPAMSAALKRLREYFNDDLLQQTGKRMVPTPHAMQVSEQIKAVLHDVEALISQSTLFDPSSSQRRFTLTASDYIATVLLAPLLRKLFRIAPGLQFDILPPGDTTSSLMEQGKLDLAILPESQCSTSHPSILLFTERFVVVGCASNPILSKPLTEDEFYEASHVVVKLGRVRPASIAQTSIDARGRSRKEDVIASSFLLAPELVVDSPHLTVMHERLALKFAELLPIRIAEMPFHLDPMSEHLQYNEARANDPGLRWLIQQMQDQVQFTLPMDADQ
jgi:DNA-binding transcriptional LysR family regulator